MIGILHQIHTQPDIFIDEWQQKADKLYIYGDR